MKFTKSILLFLISVFILTSCYDPNTTMRIVPNKQEQKLVLVDKSGELFTFTKDTYKAKLSFPKRKIRNHKTGKVFKEKYAKFVVETDEGSRSFSLNIDSKNDFLYSNAPVTYTSKDLGQEISMVVSREVEKELDIINVSVFNKQGSTLLATMQFINKNGNDKKSFDEERGEFLQSFQKVKLHQRSLVFEINAAVDNMFRMLNGYEWVADMGDNIVNYGAMLYISPWVYARYWKVNWILSDDSDNEDTQKIAWQKAISDSPVVDYVTWVHDGSQRVYQSWTNGKKENQLRMVYVGACNSGSSYEFIIEHNAAVASGHRNISASPLFQFSFFRNWAYGKSFKESIDTAYFWGVAKAKTLEFLSFAKLWQESTGLGVWNDFDDMIYDSEPILSYTSELPASEVYVGLSSSPKREDRLTSTIIEEEASKLTYGAEEKELIQSQIH